MDKKLFNKENEYPSSEEEEYPSIDEENYLSNYGLEQYYNDFNNSIFKKEPKIIKKHIRISWGSFTYVSLIPVTQDHDPIGTFRKSINSSDLFNMNSVRGPRKLGAMNNSTFKVLYGVYESKLPIVFDMLRYVRPFKIMLFKLGCVQKKTILDGVEYKWDELYVNIDQGNSLISNLRGQFEKKVGSLIRTKKRQPHIKIAFLKYGLGQKYLDRKFGPFEFIINQISVNSLEGSDGNYRTVKHTINL